MAKLSYGPQVQQRTRQLLSALLAYANDEFEDGVNVSGQRTYRLPIQVKWQTQTQLVVKTKVRFLVALMVQVGQGRQLTADQVKASLKYLKDFVPILEDHRPATRGSDEWHFTLKLWHDRWDSGKNLERLDHEWEERRSQKSQPQKSQPQKSQYLASAESVSAKASASSQARRHDWGDALDVSTFYGRVEELNELSNWLIAAPTSGQKATGCRLLLLLGMGGMGKTALSLKLAETVQNEFNTVIWRSLRNAPLPQDLLAEVIPFLAHRLDCQVSETIDGQLAQLLKVLQTKRCLVILDNVESVLADPMPMTPNVTGIRTTTTKSAYRTGRYREGYEGYGQLFRYFGETVHQSCLILTSREKPRGLSFREGLNSPVRSWQLSGLAGDAGRSVLAEKGIQASKTDIQRLIQHYAGNPLALKIVASTIQDLFSGNLAQFWQQGSAVFGDIAELLAQQFQRLSTLEQQVMYWLAINRDGISLAELRGDLIPQPSPKILLETIESLKQRCLIDVRGAIAPAPSTDDSNRNKRLVNTFTQQPVVMEYVTECLIEQMCEEIVQETLTTLNSHALIKTQTKDYCRTSQVRLILQPIVNQLLAVLGHRIAVGDCLDQLLARLRAEPVGQSGYAGGNIFNLLWQLQLDLSHYDFSRLTVWQAYLQGPTLQRVNFAHSDLSRSPFSQTLGSFLCADFSPDGNLLATGIDNRICLWTTDEGNAIRTFQGHTDWVVGLAFSTAEVSWGGSQASRPFLIASGSHDQTVRLWNRATGQCLKTLRGHTNWVQTVAFSPGDRYLASGSYDQTIRLWAVTSGQCVRVLSGHGARILWVAFTPDRQQLLSAGEDQTVRVWSVETGECLQVLEIAVNWKLAIALSPDGTILATGSHDNTVKLWQLSTGDCVRTLADYDSLVWSVAFSPDGKTLVTGSEDQTLRIWDVKTGDCLSTIADHTQRVWAVNVSPDGQTLLSISDDQCLKLWQMTTCQPLRTLMTYSNAMLSIAISPDGRWLASSSKDQFVRLWALAAGSCTLRKTLPKQAKLVTCVAFASTGDGFATGGEDQAITLWDVVSGEALQTIWGHSGWISAIAFHPYSSLMASGSHDQTIKLWDRDSGECLHTLAGHHHRVRAIAFHPQGHRLASASSDTTVKLWDVETGECLQTLADHPQSVLSVAFSPNGERLASSSSDGTIKLWDWQTGECVHTFDGHRKQVNVIAFTPTGDRLVSAGDDQLLKVWSMETKACIKSLSGHTKAVRSVAMGHDGQSVVSCSEDETLRLWGIQTGECMGVFRPDRPYEGMNITGTIGLTLAQRSMLKALGAVEDES